MKKLEPSHFDDAIVGVVTRCGQEPFIVYDSSKVIEILVEKEGMDHDEAMEWFDFNIAGAWIGEDGPGYLDPLTDDNDDDNE